MGSKKVTQQEHTGLRRTIINWLPADLNTFMFTILTIICTVVGVIHFANTGSPFLLMTLWGTFAGKIGLSKIPLRFLENLRDSEQAPQEESLMPQAPGKHNGGNSSV